MQLDEWTATLLDYGEQLAKWAKWSWTLCGVKP